MRTSAELFFAESRDAILSGVPDVLRTVILTACKYEREQRYASMLEFRDALERRIPRLPDRPHGTDLVSALLALPDGPPEWVEGGSGVDELRKVLDAGDDAPTLTRAAHTPDPQFEDGRGDPTPLVLATQYRMPGSSIRKRPESADGIPDYVDLATFHKPAVKFVEIDDTGARSLHAADPLPIGWSRWAYGALATGTAVGLFVALVVTGLLGKVYTSYQLSNAGDTSIRTAHEERQVIADLVSAGADEAALQDRFYRFEDAVAESRAPAAAEFAEMVAIQADRTGVQGLALSHVSQLGRARRDWAEARMMQTALRASFVGRMTGGRRDLVATAERGLRPLEPRPGGFASLDPGRSGWSSPGNFAPPRPRRERPMMQTALRVSLVGPGTLGFW